MLTSRSSVDLETWPTVSPFVVLFGVGMGDPPTSSEKWCSSLLVWVTLQHTMLSIVPAAVLLMIMPDPAVHAMFAVLHTIYTWAAHLVQSLDHEILVGKEVLRCKLVCRKPTTQGCEDNFWITFELPTTFHNVYSLPAPPI